ncbi:hypothetical protein F9L06_13470 [Brucella anthropi]|jgi:hypothetical protein|uniref:Uncharacterized protein n=1 Tax=Brucella anthropi TaxID=529 RepID=A0A6I0DQZ5_BRUAN|nr:hypothetical protein [Brucella anthropi]KAB2797335.1 hypothetical protein F9L06_13470 [Brucella anthropi]KIU67381.1 hypothetical protein TR92_16370 [Brucella anthropi]
MKTVSQENWYFRISNSSQMERLLGTDKPDTILEFPSGGDLVRHLGDDHNDEHMRLHLPIDERLDADPVAKEWARQRTPLKDLKHFPRYRRNEFDRYHVSARAVSTGTADVSQTTMVSGLDGEIENSRILVPAGQVLFHGRANDDLIALQPYPTYISSSLHPIIARNSAFRRAGDGNKNGQPRVFVLTLKVPLPALWGQAGKSCEYELLLPRNLFVEERTRYSGTKYETIFADVTARK